MERFINIELVRSPVNWAIVFLMLALAAVFLGLIVPPSTNED